MTKSFRGLMWVGSALLGALALVLTLRGHGAAGAVIASIPGLPVLTRDMLAARKVGMANQADVVWAPLFDFQQYPTAGQQIFTFFAQQQGTGTTSAPGAGTGVKTPQDTNLQSSGQLGKGNDFFGIRMEALFSPGVTNSTATPFGILIGRGSVALASVGQYANDVFAVGEGGNLKLQIGTDRNYILNDGPLKMFPPVTRMALATTNAVTFDSDSTATAVVEEITYAVWSGAPYNMVGVFIEALQTFGATVSYATQIATPSGVSGRLGLRFAGYLSRQVT